MTITPTPTSSPVLHLRTLRLLPVPAEGPDVPPPTDVTFSRRSLWLVALVCAVAGATSSALMYLRGYLVIYNDARSHLNISRRIFDSLTPGLAQIGSVWLPVQHALLAPLVAITPLWHSGLAGSILGLGCLVYTGLSVYRLVVVWADRPWAGWVAVAALVTNPNLLYVQTAALTEPVFMAFFSGGCYHLACWLKAHQPRNLVWAGVLTAVSAMTRYDGWMMGAVAIAVVATAETLQRRRSAPGQAAALVFGAMVVYAILLWLLFNQFIFGDALYFARGPYSAGTQQKVIAAAGRLPTKGHVGESLFTYAGSVVLNVGVLITIVGLVGTVLVARWGRRGFAGFGLVAVLWTPFLFNVFALWRGQSVLALPITDPPGFFNVRYGLLCLPGLAVGVGMVAAAVPRPRRGLAAGVLGAAIAVQAALLGVSAQPIVLEDGLRGASSSRSRQLEGPASFLRAHYRGGRVLIDDYTGSPLIFETGLRWKNFVTTGNHPYWEQALADPASQAEWLVVSPQDQVAIAINPGGVTGAEPKLAPFELRFNNDLYFIYQRRPESGRP